MNGNYLFSFLNPTLLIGIEHHKILFNMKAADLRSHLGPLQDNSVFYSDSCTRGGWYRRIKW